MKELRDSALDLVIVSSRWLPEVQNIFFQGNRRKQIPLEHLDSFFDGVAVVMTNQLREMALDSIADYLHIFCPVKVKQLTYVHMYM